MSGDELPVVFSREELAAHDRGVESAVLRRFAAYLRVKTANFRHGAMSESEQGYDQGMINALVDAELFADGLEMPDVEPVPFPGEHGEDVGS